MEDRIFKIASTAPYPVKDIVDFMALTGLSISETERVITDFCYCGISNLLDVNILAKLGF